ncbi:MAG: terminase family protein [Planctomycetota bacterium]
MTIPVDLPELLPGRNAPFWRQMDPEFNPDGRIRLGGMFEHQRAWWALPTFVKLLVGGYGCVAAETIVGGLPIAERKDASLLRTLAGPAYASASHLKGRAALYRVATRRGREVVVTAHHRFLTPHGWRRLAELAEGDVIGGSAPEDDRRRSERERGWPDRCFGDFRQHGAQLIHAAGLSRSSRWRSSPPSTCPPCIGRGARLARSGSRVAEAIQLRAFDVVLGSESALAGWSHLRLRRPSRSQSTSSAPDKGAPPVPTSGGFLAGDYGSICDLVLCTADECSYPPTIPVWDTITEIAFDRVGQFYDLHVPGLEHYEAHGLWHHNSGKTISLCKRASGVALTNAPCPVAVVSPSFPIAKRTTIATFRELFRGKETLLGPYGFSWRENKTDHVFHVSYLGRTAEIQIYTGDNPDALKGPNLAAAYVDEPFIQDQAVFDQMVARVRHPKARLREIALTGTPEQLNWGFELCEGELRDRYDVGFIRAATNLNRALPPEYVERLLSGFDEKARDAYVRGLFVNLAAGRVYYGFEREENVVDMSIPPEADLGVGMDFNVDPMAFVVFWKLRDHVHVFEEFELENSDTEDAAALLRHRFPDLTDVYPDASGRARSTKAPRGVSDFTHLRDRGFEIHARTKNPAHRDRFNAVNARLRPTDGGRVRITISPSCKKLIRYLQAYTHSEMHTQSHKDMSHLLDAFSYPLAYLFPLDRRPARTVGVLGH